MKSPDIAPGFLANASDLKQGVLNNGSFELYIHKFFNASF